MRKLFSLFVALFATINLWSYDFQYGDLYYKTQYADHNLDRTRTQLKLVADMESKWDEMNAIVKKYS